MAIFNDTYFHFVTDSLLKNNKHLYSIINLHREVNGYWPAYFPQRKLVRHENIIFEMAFCKTFCATRDFKEVEECWLIYFLMTTNTRVYIIEDNEEFRKVSRDTMKGQFQHDLYRKSFSILLESDETDG